MAREYHSHDWPLAFIRDFHGPSPKIRHAVREKGTQHQAIRKKHCSGMDGRKVGHIAADVILKILIWRRQVKVKSRHGLWPQIEELCLTMRPMWSATIQFVLEVVSPTHHRAGAALYA
jgi:hypothetical protein